MTSTRTVLKLREVIGKAEAGIIDDTTDTESVLDVDIDSAGVDGRVPATVTRAIEDAIRRNRPNQEAEATLAASDSL